MKRMNSRLLSALLAVLLFSFTSAQADCEAKKAEAKACFDALEANPQEACFQRDGCQLPAESEKHAERSQCKNAVFDKLKPLLEACVAKTQPGFKLPSKENRGGKRHGKGGPQLDAKKLCSTAEARKAAKECLKTVPKSDKKAESKKCRQIVPKECRGVPKEAREALCACATEIVPKSVQLLDDFAKCFPEKKDTSKQLLAKFCEKKHEKKGKKQDGKGNKASKMEGSKGKEDKHHGNDQMMN